MCSWMIEEGTEFPGARITGGYELPDLNAGTQT